MDAKVVRLDTHGETVSMTRGFSGPSYEEPRFRAVIYDADGQYVAEVGNSSILCLPGRTVRAPEATDAEILEAVLNDESIFD